uniref:Uncharacterized protein n=1 Tax=Geospiza parvula TaxID=87175 RepID=A0A8C3N632_GEOPR
SGLLRLLRLLGLTGLSGLSGLSGFPCAGPGVGLCGFLSAPKTPVLGIIGDKVVLPCQVGSAPIPEDFSIHWTFHVGQSQQIPVGSYGGKGRREEPDERYQGRAELFHREFRAGNASLLLRDVRSSDQGSYSCQVSFQDESWEVLVELEVAGWCCSHFLMVLK